MLGKYGFDGCVVEVGTLVESGGKSRVVDCMLGSCQWK